MGGRESKCGVRVQNNTRSVNKVTQRTTMKRSFYWHVFFIKYVFKDSLIIHEENTKKNHKRVVSLYVDKDFPSFT